MFNNALIMGAVGVVIGVICLTIVDSIITDTLFSGTLNTIAQNIPILMGVGLLALAAGWIFLK